VKGAGYLIVLAMVQVHICFSGPLSTEEASIVFAKKRQSVANASAKAIRRETLEQNAYRKFPSLLPSLSVVDMVH